MNILFAVSEAAPFAKTGGLADVAGALPTALAELGEQVYLFLPLYREIKETYKEFMNDLRQIYLNAIKGSNLNRIIDKDLFHTAALDALDLKIRRKRDEQEKNSKVFNKAFQQNTITLKSKFWYEIVYSSGEKLFFQFLDTTQVGRIRCRLCDGKETLEIFRGTFMEIIEKGVNKPCEQ